MTACMQPGCGGSIVDGFCDVCGMAPAESAGASAAAACEQPGCDGSVVDGYCDVCGLAPAAGTMRAPAPTVRSGSTSRGASRRGTSRSSSRSTRTSRSTSRGRLGAGLIKMPEVPYRDPATAIMNDPKVPEKDRFCANCDHPVGRGRDGAPGRTDGFCRNCGAAYSFTPKLGPGDMVSGQYEVLGCLAHGGLGWIYLARDRNVSNRWVVLKGLLNTSDPDAMAAAVAERQFLAAVEHPNIVKIYNFVQHPDPKTGELVGYIVMEYVGGSSLKQLRSAPGADGVIGPMPVAQGLAYVLEILPALGYLHAQDLLFCDFKPDNVIQTEEQLKLIDLGAVRRIDDDESAGYKTDGYAAPELESEGASVESDLFTVGRTLAVLTFNFDWRGQHVTTLPDPAEVPALAAHPSFRRLLKRATAAAPGDRFGSAAEMADQVTGVLREVVAGSDGQPRPGLSRVFSAERGVFGADPDHWPAKLDPFGVAKALPVPLVDPTDSAASFLATLTITDPQRLIEALLTAPATMEVRLAQVRAHIEAHQVDAAVRVLSALEDSDDADWRITWYNGLAAMASGDATRAHELFDTAYDLLPGEAATKLALAACAEGLGDFAGAAALYELVWRTDHGYASAAFGLARSRLYLGDKAGAVEAAESVPVSSSHYVAARLAAIRARIAVETDPAAARQYLVDAGTALGALELDAKRLAQTSIGILDAAHALVDGQPGGSDRAHTVLGCAFDDRSVRRGLESHYRTLARLAPDKQTRQSLIIRANTVRPVTWI